ncbi:unnamed protein product [Rotaria socialis]|uniref:Uncharacterized protein n=1 Tax=Rotaria socialis TaxID=392032 RepID=A0A818MB51_9BILA|nr:unnamed protein product [Rotaria socialis]CAF3586241.1 unnamed protein product [Rotaria socialis]CAF4473954.1 unnamed protein product [Rotaria socialis]CAF4521467.1 unnamed protein product [Rotaria socialis]
MAIKHIIAQALRRYTNLQNAFNLLTEFREQAQKTRGVWELIAKSLISGYNENVFISMKELQDRVHQFMQYKDRNDIAVIDSQSTLARHFNELPVSLVLARDIRYLSAVRSTAILSFIGEIKPEWIDYNLKRQIHLIDEEEIHLNTNNKFSNAISKFSNKINMLLNNHSVSLIGSVGVVLNAELHLRQDMISEYTFSLENKNPPKSSLYDNLSRNLESVMKMTRIFRPMIWRWQNQRQVKITVDSDTATKTCEATVVGRNSDIKKVKEEFDSFLGWLQKIVLLLDIQMEIFLRTSFHGVAPRVLHPQMRKDCYDIEERISRITDSKRTLTDLYNGAKGSKATRETRMEVVAWIAVCKFDCKLEGDFVRDWAVGNYTSKPTNNPNSWVQYALNKKGDNIPYIEKEVVPGDLDCHLPSHRYFDVDKFQDELYKFDIQCKVFRENWRYAILIDENTRTGPFTMDLIEPHAALMHDRIDFDANNLSIEKDFTRDLAMRVNIQ